MFFNKSAQLEAQIDSMLDDISQAAILFHAAIGEYLDGNWDNFNERLERVGKLESDVDVKRRDIRTKLYTKMLIPESRGDVLSLLENIDNVIDLTKDVLQEIRVERPEIPEDLKSDYLKLAEASKEAMNYTVLAARTFFREVHLINDYINKTFIYEHEADVFERQIKEKVFLLEDMDLAHKMQLRDFSIHIASVSDESESVCERLSVAAIKRTI